MNELTSGLIRSPGSSVTVIGCLHQLFELKEICSQSAFLLKCFSWTLWCHSEADLWLFGYKMSLCQFNVILISFEILDLWTEISFVRSQWPLTLNFYWVHAWVQQSIWARCNATPLVRSSEIMFRRMGGRTDRQLNTNIKAKSYGSLKDSDIVNPEIYPLNPFLHMMPVINPLKLNTKDLNLR